MDIEMMADLFTREITEGMGDTLIKAGMIKCATGEGRISEKEAQVLRAAARAHKATGCPIITHTTNGMGLEQLDLFESEGVQPEEVIVSHIGFEKDPLDYSERMLRRGANISFDRIEMKAFFDDEHWVAIVGQALKKGYVRQTMISHDICQRILCAAGAGRHSRGICARNPFSCPNKNPHRIERQAPPTAASAQSRPRLRGH
jgi:phosphotriesterase-related protein